MKPKPCSAARIAACSVQMRSAFARRYVFCPSTADCGRVSAIVQPTSPDAPSDPFDPRTKSKSCIGREQM